MLDNKFKLIIGGIAVLGVGMIAYSKVSEILSRDPTITGLQAEFVGEITPGQEYTRDMFVVKGVTESGELVQLNNFTAVSDIEGEPAVAAANGSTCEVVIESQGYEDTTIVTITREPELYQNIGYPNEEDAVVTYYTNGDLEFTGSGDITNFGGSSTPWAECKYTHVYIDESLEIENMDNWFSGNTNLVYCDDLPKTVKTIRNTFYNCTSLEKTPGYFQCNNLQIMDYAFAGCSSLKEADVVPVNVSSMQYTFQNCTALQKPISLDKTSNLTNISGIYSGCAALREVSSIPESVTTMKEAFKDCINIKTAVKFPSNVQTIASAYAGCKGLETAVSIPESVIDCSSCYYGCTSLSGSLEINTDTSSYSGLLQNAATNGDTLSIFGNSGNLLAIQKDSGNNNVTLQDAEAASQQHERMLREQEVE